MSILDTFYVLFKTNADDAARDIEKVDRSSDRAEGALKKMDRAAASVGQSFVHAATAIAAPLLALASFDAVVSGVQLRARAILQLDQVASALNSSVSDVDAFTRAIKAAGGETEQGIDSLRKYAEQLNVAASDANSSQRKTFKEWGLVFTDVKGNALGAVDGIIALAESLEGVSRAEALARIKQLGIEDATTIDLLLKGRRAVEDRMRVEKEQGVVTKEQVRLSRDYQRELGQTANLLQSFGNRIVESVLPAITSMIGSFRRVLEWIESHRALVEGFFLGVAAVVTTVYLPAMVRAGIATLAATWPFLLIAGAVAAVGAAFALVYEDLQAWVNGQPSLIGELLGPWEDFYAKIKPILDGVREAWAVVSAAMAEQGRDLWDAVQEVGGGIIDILQGLADFVNGVLTGDWKRAFGGLGTAVTGMAEVVNGTLKHIWETLENCWSLIAPILDKLGMLDPIEAAWRSLEQVLDGVLGGIGSAFETIWSTISPVIDGLKWVIDKGGDAIGAIRGAFGGGEDQPPAPANPATIRGVQAGRQQIQAAASLPAGAVPGAMARYQERVSNVTVGSVVVNTQATDAVAIAASVQSELQNVLQDASAQFDDGVDC